MQNLLRGNASTPFGWRVVIYCNSVPPWRPLRNTSRRETANCEIHEQHSGRSGPIGFLLPPMDQFLLYIATLSVGVAALILITAP